MTFNAANRLRSLEDRSAAPGSSCCELPGMHSVPKSAVLPYASGVGGLSRRLFNIYIYIYTHIERERERESEGLDPGSTLKRACFMHAKLCLSPLPLCRHKV